MKNKTFTLNPSFLMQQIQKENGIKWKKMESV